MIVGSRESDEDKHQAPASAPHRPLSLQDVGTQASHYRFRLVIFIRTDTGAARVPLSHLVVKNHWDTGDASVSTGTIHAQHKTRINEGGRYASPVYGRH